MTSMKNFYNTEEYKTIKKKIQAMEANHNLKKIRYVVKKLYEEVRKEEKLQKEIEKKENELQRLKRKMEG